MFGGVLSGFLGDHKIIPLGRYMMMGMFLTCTLLDPFFLCVDVC